MLPANSYVISMALFDGEFLYNIMHKHVHPIGCTYDDIYNLMNVLEENPCWGWLNSNQTVRQNTTKISNSLNNVYRRIEREQNFKNFKFALYAPQWASLFADYQKAGHPLTDLIEAVDGFHPSQTGNAIFAQKIFEWLEVEHPEAIGPINPHNDEIDRMFFAQQKN
jgi:acyloxyacyl hydrolase